MISIITGSLIISFLHAVIPNHWLPVIAIGRKEQWTIAEVTKVTLSCALAHGLSTILIGVILGIVGARLDNSLRHFTSIIAPTILILIGLAFIYRHHTHRHFHMDENIKRKKTKTAIITALVAAMFFSPCMEIEAYFLLAGAQATWLIWFIALLYLIITTTGMLLLVRFAYHGSLKLNWHSLEHNAGIITGAYISSYRNYFIFRAISKEVCKPSLGGLKKLIFLYQKHITRHTAIFGFVLFPVLAPNFWLFSVISKEQTITGFKHIA